MAVVFSESRALPRELRQMGHYRSFADATYREEDLHGNMNTESAVADIFRSITQGAVDFFGGSSSAAKQAAAQAAAMQAQALQEQTRLAASQGYEDEQTKRTLIYVGAGLVGVVVLVLAFKSGRGVKIKNRVGGYRRRKRSRR